MKTKLSIFLTALVGGLISAMPARAATMFSNDGIIFGEDTEVQFDFLQSNGAWQGTFGVVKLGTGEETVLLKEDLNFDPGRWMEDNLGTPDVAVKDIPANFIFEAGEEYSLFLRSVKTDGSESLQYSKDSKNNYNSYSEETVTIADNSFDSRIDGMVVDRSRRALFVGDTSSVDIFFEDANAWSDNDFDDFVVKAQIVESTPEPATLAGLGIVAGGMFLSRSGKKQK